MYISHGFPIVGESRLYRHHDCFTPVVFPDWHRKRIWQTKISVIDALFHFMKFYPKNGSEFNVFFLITMLFLVIRGV